MNLERGGGGASAASGAGGIGMMADGGPVFGAGTSRSDSILARLSHGEYVVNAAATAQHRSTLDAINTGRTPGFANGGPVTALPSYPRAVPNAGAQRTPSPTLRFGDIHIHAVGGAQFSQEQIGRIKDQVVAGNQQTVEHITRNLSQIQSDAQQAA